LTAEKLVQRRDDLALTDAPSADQIDMAERAPLRPDRIFQRTGEARFYVVKLGPENHQLLVPKPFVENRIQLSEIGPNSPVRWLSHLADEVLVEIDQQFSGPRDRHGALVTEKRGSTKVASPPGAALASVYNRAAICSITLPGPLRQSLPSTVITLQPNADIMDGCTTYRAVRSELL